MLCARFWYQFSTKLDDLKEMDLKKFSLKWNNWCRNTVIFSFPNIWPSNSHNAPGLHLKLDRVLSPMYYSGSLAEIFSVTGLRQDSYIHTLILTCGVIGMSLSRSCVGHGVLVAVGSPLILFGRAAWYHDSAWTPEWACRMGLCVWSSSSEPVGESTRAHAALPLTVERSRAGISSAAPPQ